MFCFPPDKYAHPAGLEEDMDGGPPKIIVRSNKRRYSGLDSEAIKATKSQVLAFLEQMSVRCQRCLVLHCVLLYRSCTKFHSFSLLNMLLAVRLDRPPGCWILRGVFSPFVSSWARGMNVICVRPAYDLRLCRHVGCLHPHHVRPGIPGWYTSRSHPTVRWSATIALTAPHSH